MTACSCLTAMAYRHQNGVDHNAVAMAVVAQQMVPSDVSGIMFTANPATGKQSSPSPHDPHLLLRIITESSPCPHLILTGERSEIIINASFGLGEAVVSGLVTPDTYIVNRESGEIVTTIGAKEQRIVSDGEQGVSSPHLILT